MFDNMDQVMKALKSDGVPRYAVFITDELRKLCAANESMREGESLWLKPDPTSPWFYANSSCGSPAGQENVSTTFPLLTSRPKFRTGAEGLELLSVSCNVALFGVASDVKKDTELLVS